MLETGFNFPIRVYYEDTDAGGVVYHARYLHFFERARTEYLRSLNFSQQTLLNERQLAFVVKTMNIDYCFPARLDDLLIVETIITGVKGASISFIQKLKKNELILCEATVKVACVDLGKMKPVAIPIVVKTALVR
ncbi:tol-pal system-associated acyl-CoA thioesterase [Pasteurella canis]|uniref:Acyl-CoA thioesterase YbgC n=1 Tax=Pasteurella canis TaxID=753 RepID=A0A379ESK7_9PAST|nr:tol-pal system-associated acyl-CoA thioesterase [Pasteurella canis]MXN89567.1 tol-pal system-associated acyl-CoA thioesterase [Pasteurella canis]UAY77966.1 tol-pal system-associated acyl-CoA thioesterase [Pasteurella canis]UDW83982.1 tol-pal system-associated acyl-CoA thioesterase [Pasteurella canis]UEC23497.1 tol-pal system-associated acyl-CoA thioesterase [Pasteurella canis]SPY33582.1 thioesterase superfamily protein [Pasteurella canis]